MQKFDSTNISISSILEAQNVFPIGRSALRNEFLRAQKQDLRQQKIAEAMDLLCQKGDLDAKLFAILRDLGGLVLFGVFVASMLKHC